MTRPLLIKFDMCGNEYCVLKYFFLEVKPELDAFFLQGWRKAGVPAVENCDSAPVVIFQLGKNFVPVWSSSIGLGFQPSDPVFFVLLKVPRIG